MLGVDEGNDVEEQRGSGLKCPYKARKLENRLKKYEAILKNDEGIKRVDTESQFLFVGNCGLANNISQELLEEKFKEYGKVMDVLMPTKKSYSFVIFEDAKSTLRALNELQGKIITSNQTPICFYLFPVDRVPNRSMCDFEETDELPEGLVYVKDYVSDECAKKLIESVSMKGKVDSDLKKRHVKHFGFEFRYGSNDCDESKPLEGDENQIPVECAELIERMVREGLIKCAPDQLTVNFYSPGQGIPPHVDNTAAFEDFIVSLSLGSAATMEFRHPAKKRLAKLHLLPNSLLIMRGESRYVWSHSIPERKHDLITTTQGILVEKRELRVSLTFRKLKKAGGVSDGLDGAEEMKLPMNEKEAQEFEKSFVHEIYDEIADHFSQTRHSTWPGVAKFISALEPYSLMLDIGCGNGKYLKFRPDLISFGCDYSPQLIRICQERNFNCFVSDCLRLPCKTGGVDSVICIAVLHHLSTLERRVAALKEMCRILKPGGLALVTVWAKEQKYKNQESFYISQKKKTDEQEIKKEDSGGLVHKFGREFEKKDLFVAWHLKSKDKKSTSISETETTAEKKDKVFLRFYHVFENKELDVLFDFVPEAKIVESYYEQGNWCVVFQRI